MGYKIANASVDMAMSGFSPLARYRACRTQFPLREPFARNGFGKCQLRDMGKSVDDQQQLLAESFKSIPTPGSHLAFVQDAKCAAKLLLVIDAFFPCRGVDTYRSHCRANGSRNGNCVLQARYRAMGLKPDIAISNAGVGNFVSPSQTFHYRSFFRTEL